MSRPLRVAVIGAGPAGIYASDLLMKSDTDVLIDLYERMPAPFGLIRYGVAPDHPRIKGIVTSLHKVLDKPELRLLGNIDIGNEVTVDELREYYDAIIFSTGATGDRNLDIPGADLEGSFGAGEFVGFYDGNPDFERSWDLSAESVAVVGVGNVGLDVARILAKTGDELHVTEIPDNVYQSLKNNKAKEVHVFGRRGPAQAKFTPLELKELDHSPTIEVIVNPEDIIYDDASEQARRSSKTQDLVCNVLEQYAIRDPKGAPHKLYIHFFESPVEILGEDGHVVGIRTERTELDGNGGVRGTGHYTDWPVQAVYRAVGYRSDAVGGVPFDAERAVIPNDGGQNNILGSVLKEKRITDDYVYLASDATKSYNSQKASLVVREFIYFYPDLFVVFDRVTATDKNYPKTWLIHTINEPVMKGNREFSETSDGGKMICRTLFPANATLTKIGGSGKDFWSDGRNWPLPKLTPQDYGYNMNLPPANHPQLGHWRIEVSPKTASDKDLFMHVIQVGDKNLSHLPDTETFETATQIGIKFTYLGKHRTLTFDKTKSYGCRIQ